MVSVSSITQTYITMSSSMTVNILESTAELKCLQQTEKATRHSKSDNIRTKTIRPSMKPYRHQPNTNDEHLNEKPNTAESSNTNPDMMLQVLEQLKQMNTFLINNSNTNPDMMLQVLEQLKKMNTFLINTRSPLPPPHIPPTGPYYRSLIPPVAVPPGQPAHW